MGVVLNGWLADCPLFARTKIIDGRKLEAGDTGKVMIGRVLAANLGKKVGDTIELYESIPHQIIGVYESPIVFENGGAVVLLSDMQDMMTRPGEVTGFTMIADDEARANDLKDLRQRIAALPEAKEIDVRLEATPSSDFVKGVSQIKVSRAVAWLTSAIALVIGAIGMLNTMIMSVFERTKEIGTLRAIGWKRSRIIKMVIGESMLLSLGGAIVGSLGGIFLVKILNPTPQCCRHRFGPRGNTGHRRGIFSGNSRRRIRRDLSGAMERQFASHRSATKKVVQRFVGGLIHKSRRNFRTSSL